MRAITNISLTPQLNDLVNQVIDSGQYASKSEFFRSILRDWSERYLASELKKSQQQIKQSKGKLLTSLKDLR